MSWWDEWGKDTTGAALGAAGLAFAKEGYGDVGKIGKEAYEAMSGKFDAAGNLTQEGLAQELRGMMEFQPYTVTSATGGQFGMGQMPDTVDAEGNVVPGGMDYKLNLSPDEQAFYEARLAGSQGMFAAAETDTAAREQQVFQRMMDSINPQRERERLALEERLQGQGRLGVQTSMFGGTPEGLAMAKAQEEAYSRNMLGAMEFAGQEQSRQAALGAGMLASSYIPQAQLLSGLQPGMTAAEQRRQAVSEQSLAYGETYASGLEALLQSALGQANIAGGVGGRLASAAIGGLFG
jgi:hypothetical protein